jgi:hypothetical protein
MADIAVVCAGPSVLTTWPGHEKSHDVNVAVNTASDYVPDDVLHWWAAGDLLNMPAHELPSVIKRFPAHPQFGVLINRGTPLPPGLAHCLVHCIQDHWPLLEFRRRTFTGPSACHFVASVLKPDRITVYGCDCNGDVHANGVPTGDTSERWPIEATAWCRVIDTYPGITFNLVGHDGHLHLRRISEQFPAIAERMLSHRPRAMADMLAGVPDPEDVQVTQLPEPEPERVWIKGNYVPVAQAMQWRM